MTDAELIAAIRAAILDEGHEPAYHRQVLARHRREWPTLWRVLDQIAAK